MIENYKNNINRYMDNGPNKDRSFYNKLLLRALIIGVPILMMSPIMGWKTPITLTIPYANVVCLLLSTILIVNVCFYFYQKAFAELKRKNPGFMCLVVLALSISYSYSCVAVLLDVFFRYDYSPYFFEFCSLAIIVLIGQCLEIKTVGFQQADFNKIIDFLPKTYNFIHGDKIIEKNIDEIKIGQKVRVKENEIIPADGTIIFGNPSVNESFLTGKTQLISKKVGDKVACGTVNSFDYFDFLVEDVRNDQYLEKLKSYLLIDSKNRRYLNKLIDSISKNLFYIALVVGLLSFFIWQHFLGTAKAVPILVTVLIICCPHSLALAVPVVTSMSDELASEENIKINNRTAFLELNHIKFAIINNFGILSTGKTSVQKVSLAEDANMSKRDMLSILYGLEVNIKNIVSRSIIEYLKESLVEITNINDVKKIENNGVLGSFAEIQYGAVSFTYLKENAYDYNQREYDQYKKQGYNVVYLVDLDHKKILMTICVGDTIREDSRQFINTLQAKNIEVVLLTTEKYDSVQKLANSFGIKTVISDVSLQKKKEIVEDYKSRGKVMVVGKQLNDIDLLDIADVSITLSSASEAIKQISDIVIADNKIAKLSFLFNLAKLSFSKEQQNIIISCVYNITAIPIAAGILAPIGIFLNPEIAAVCMLVSLMIVIFNSMILKFKIKSIE